MFIKLGGYNYGFNNIFGTDKSGNDKRNNRNFIRF